VLTTHQLDEAERRCERIVVIDHGKTVAEGTLRELTHSVLGTARSVAVSTDQPVPSGTSLPTGAALDADGRVVRAKLDNVSRQLPELLQALTSAGAAVTNIETSGGSLQDVFIALTGRELRE
jgi:ABC-2 type transport system ATP-binding protein